MEKNAITQTVEEKLNPRRQSGSAENRMIEISVG